MTTQNRNSNSPVNSRRTTLRGIGAGLVALGTLPLLDSDAAGKHRKKTRKDRCLPQVAACETVAATFCADATDRAQCQATLARCCQPLGTCDGDQSIQCVIDAFTQKV